jgi:hypothetical protein
MSKTQRKIIWNQVALEWMPEHILFYLEIPLLIKYKIPYKGPTVPEIFIGPYYGIKVSSEVINIFDDWDEYMIDLQTDLEDSIKKWDFGLVLGAGLSLEVCFGKLYLDARYSLGLVNILEDSADLNHKLKLVEGFQNNDSIRNKAFTIMVGWGF